MSYNIYLYHPDVKIAAASGVEIEDIDIPPIPEEVRQRFVDRLLKYDYEVETANPNCNEFIHKNKNWSIQVAVFRTAIAFSVPYWDDAENANFDALQTAHELADNGDIVVWDPQTEEWGS